MTKDNTTTGPPSTPSRRLNFLGCFGFSGENMNIQLTDHKLNSTSRRRSRIFKWSFSCKKSTTTKTVHVDFNTVSSKSLNAAPVKTDTTWEIQVVEEDATLTKKHVIMVDTKHVPVASEEAKTCRKKWTDVVKRQNGSTRRKEMKPVATSATVELKTSVMMDQNNENIVNSNPSSLKPLTHSISLPAKSKRRKPTKVDKGVVGKTTSLSSGGEFDSIIGMTILLVILVIMVLWGKLCAIICTCAWFSVAPRLVAVGERSAVATVEGRLPEMQKKVNLESVEYKKKVVLEGLLQRNHRNVVGRLFKGCRKYTVFELVY
ncbi:hypothetical protein HanRHA438_Chr06g0257781 [Helianthus annuus]|uniref:Uncharacterized protein n=2 Tax=Helianthus annuus TaxID=4232 RepID=A0A9K3IQX7_HELAN|nr:hypothetical protein HanXRQr2_Chr06g0248521 [Helianthus annuus]KAJ0559778.1 hypothetical protein HanHA300_Chr06g0204141 [Helianthus annuus]KAJ0572756.1 hypothetical protein HanHA89_Chr06g0219211 [Helianthus annuus]KAJ0737190.1 hypothetical protein HanLR1_Chr06g0204191 [Helianthus annuus]KAJ0910941.1 hypothetical protein HanRHA438_Chr06g0257781 [Helianthus annuus]